MMVKPVRAAIVNSRRVIRILGKGGREVQCRLSLKHYLCGIVESRESDRKQIGGEKEAESFFES